MIFRSSFARCCDGRWSMQGRGFEGEHGWYLNTDWHRLNGWVIGKQILRKSVLNLCFASSSIWAVRYMEQIFWRLVLIGQPLFGKETTVGKLKALHLLGLGNTNDIAFACIYLMSDTSRWVTGSNLVVDVGIRRDKENRQSNY